MDANLQILGLAKKAGLLAVGSRDTLAAAREGKVSAVLSASDASANAVRNARMSAESCSALHAVVPYSGFELGNVSGRGSPATVAFLDAGLAERFLRGLSRSQPELYLEAAEQLAERASNRPPNGRDDSRPPTANSRPKLRNRPSGKRRTTL